MTRLQSFCAQTRHEMTIHKWTSYGIAITAGQFSVLANTVVIGRERIASLILIAQLLVNSRGNGD